MSHVGSTAPARVELTGRRSTSDLLWVANTRHGPGGHWFARVSADSDDHDHLADPDEAVDYLERHHVQVPSGRPTRVDLDRLAALREAARALAGGDRATMPDEARSILRRARYELREDGRLEAVGRGWRAFVDDLVPVLISLLRSGVPVRMCGNPYCRLVFVDSSRSRTRQWCDTAGCGNRARVGRHRQREHSAA
jgi:predicted RNA-binding Zn ribbon-like protein